MMRKTLAATALGATIVLGGPQLAAQAETATPVPTPVATATDAATDTVVTESTPAATATETQTEQVTTTVEKKDRTGLWGLLGLTGLLGLAGLKKKPEQHVVTRPAHVDHREPVRTTRTDATHTDTTVRDADVRDPKLDRDLNNDGRRDI